MASTVHARRWTVVAAAASVALATLLAGCTDDGVRRGDRRTLAKLDDALASFMAATADGPGPVGAIAYVDDGVHGVTWSAARGRIAPTERAAPTVDTPFRIASITKTFVAAATLRLVERGRFALDAPIDGLLGADSLAALTAGGADPTAISVRQLLGHRSGLYDYAGTAEFFAAVQANPSRRWTRLEQLQLGLSLMPPAAPGSVYAYSDTNYILLGEILERATARPLAAALRETLDYQRLGLTHTWLESLEPIPARTAPRMHQTIVGIDTFGVDPSFDLWGGGGLVSTVDDLARFYRALFRGDIVRRDTLAQMTDAISGGGFAEQAYALGLMAFYLGDAACYGHEGVSYAVAAYCPSLQTTFVVTQVTNENPGLTLDRPGLVQRFATALGIPLTSGTFGADYRRTRCTPELAAASVPVGCGMLAVPETRPAVGGRTIELALAIARHPSQKPTLDPLLVLGGGPGDPLLPEVPALLADPDLARALTAGQDVVYVEQRGVGASRPVLACAEPIVEADTAAACVAALQAEGVALDQYNSIASAADMEALRTTLGVARWNLLGFSYGSRLALTMARERPATIASLVLDGAFPPEQGDENDAPRFVATLDALLQQCRADAGCDAAFPSLRARFADAVRELNAAPVLVGDTPISGDLAVTIVGQFQGQRELIPYLPAVMDALIRRDPEFLAALVAPTAAGAAQSVFSDAMFFSVHCNEETAFLDRAALAAQQASDDPLLVAAGAPVRLYDTICGSWPSGRAPDREQEPVDVQVPVLVLNGEFDLQTPPDAGRLAAARWPQAQVVEFRGSGHVATKQTPACAVDLIARFERSAAGTRIDTGCADAPPGTSWRTSLDATFYGLLNGG